MAFEQGLCGAEFRQYLVVGHALASRGLGAGIGVGGAPRNHHEFGRDAALEGLECPPYKAATFEACQGWRLVAKPIRVG
jgi:hypothetical protein